MANNSIFDFSTTAGSNADIGGNGIQGSSNISLGNDVLQSLAAMLAGNVAQRGTDIATASTLDFTAVGVTTKSLVHDLTGTTTVTAVTMGTSNWRICRAAGAFQLTASASLIVNGSTSTNYTTTAGDLLFFEAYSAGVVRVWAFFTAAGGTLTGNLTISKATPSLTLARAATNQFTTLNFNDPASVQRWVIAGNADATHSLFVNRYNSSSVFQDTPLTINGSDGSTFFTQLYTTNAAGGAKGADTINTTTYYKGGNYGVVTLGTPTASTSGTAVGFTGIPSGVRRVTMSLKAVSTNGTSVPIIQIGSGSYTTSGYVAYGNNLAAASANFAGAAFTNGIPVGSGSIGAADAYYGLYVFQLENASTNSWVAFGGVSGNGALVGFGGVSLGGALDRIQLTTSGGTATFDAGEINITYE